MNVMALFLPEIKEMLDARDFRSVRRLVSDINPVDLADGWASFSPQEQAAMFRVLPRRKAAQLFEELDPQEQQALLTHVREVDIRELVTDLDPSETSRLSRELPPKLVSKLFAFMKKDSARQVETFLNFPPKTVGSLMRTRFVRLKPSWTAKQALEHVQITTRLRQIDQTYLENLFVTDDQDRWLGHVPLRVLIVAPRDMAVSELLRKAARWFTPEMDQEEAANVFRKYKMNSAPVLDPQQRLLGILLVRDVLDVLEEEVEEDFAKMAGTGRPAPPAAGVWESARIRLPWLAITCVGQLLVSVVIRGFERTLSEIIALATFMPLIAAMGGNVGSQSAVLVVRALATGELEDKEGLRTVLRDLRVGLALGLFYSAAMVAASHLFYGARFGWGFSLVVGLGTVTSMTIAATLGAGVPFLFRRLRIDPATAAGPLVTTITDLISTASYLAFAALMLRWTR